MTSRRASGSQPLEQPGTVALMLVFAVLAGVAGLVFGVHAGKGLERYRSPFARKLAWGEGGQPLSRRLVICLVDGLRDDTSRSVPELEELRRRGADLRLEVPEPTASVAVAHVLLTGAPQQTIGLLGNSVVDPAWYATFGNLYTAAQRVGLESANFVTWAPGHALERILDAPHTLRPESADDDAVLLPALLPFLAARPDVELVWVHFDIVDHAAHAAGAASDAYAESARRTGDRIGRIAAALALERDTLVVTSDHGQLSAGGHWGGESEVATVPAVLAGAGIRRGVVGGGRLIDLASTAAILIGAPVPTHNQGWPLFEVLDLAPASRARRARDVVVQRLGAYRARREALGWPGPQTPQSAAAIDARLREGDWQGAFAAAGELERQLAEGWRGLLAEAGRRQMLLRLAASAGLLAILVPVLLVALRWLAGCLPRWPPAWLVFGVLAAAASPAALYLAAGRRYSLSWVAQKGVLAFIPGRLLEGLVGLAIGYGLARTLAARVRPRPRYELAFGAVLGGVVAGTATVALLVGWICWTLRGLEPQPWHTTYADVAFVLTETLHLAAMAAVAVAALLAVGVRAAWLAARRRSAVSPG